MDRRLCTLFALALMTTAGCDSGAKTPAHDTFSLVGGMAGENIAPLAYGATSQPIAVPNGFGYGWLRLDGHAGDAIDIWVRGSADAVAFLLDGEDNLIAANDDAATGIRDAHLVATLTSSGTYYVAFRDYNYGRASFTVSATRRPVAPPPPAVPATSARSSKAHASHS